MLAVVTINHACTTKRPPRFSTTCELTSGHRRQQHGLPQPAVVDHGTVYTATAASHDPTITGHCTATDRPVQLGPAAARRTIAVTYACVSYSSTSARRSPTTTAASGELHRVPPRILHLRPHLPFCASRRPAPRHVRPTVDAACCIDCNVFSDPSATATNVAAPDAKPGPDRPGRPDGDHPPRDPDLHDRCNRVRLQRRRHQRAPACCAHRRYPL